MTTTTTVTPEDDRHKKRGVFVVFALRRKGEEDFWSALLLPNKRMRVCDVGGILRVPTTFYPLFFSETLKDSLLNPKP